MARVVLARRPEAESAGVLLRVVGEVVEGHGVGLVRVVPAYAHARKSLRSLLLRFSENSKSLLKAMLSRHEGPLVGVWYHVALVVVGVIGAHLKYR